MSVEGCYFLFANVVLLACKDAQLPEPKRAEMGYMIRPTEARAFLASDDCADLLDWLGWTDRHLEELRRRENLRLVFPGRSRKTRAHNVAE